MNAHLEQADKPEMFKYITHHSAVVLVGVASLVLLLSLITPVILTQRASEVPMQAELQWAIKIAEATNDSKGHPKRDQREEKPGSSTQYI